MCDYNYLDAITSDIVEYIKDNYDEENFDTLDNLYYELYDDLFVNDSVTGNASGSYTFSTYKAEEYLCHNMDLLKEALEEFGCGIEYLEKGAEACDVTIRCYLLGEALTDAINQLKEQY